MREIFPLLRNVQRLCPWTPLGALPPDPRYRLALRARHGLKPPKLKILATSLTPLDRAPTKFGTDDYVGGPYGCAKFGANPSMKASGQMGEI